MAPGFVYALTGKTGIASTIETKGVYMSGITEDPFSDGKALPGPPPLILVVDDDESHRSMVLDYLQSIDYCFKGASNAYEALEITNHENIDLIVSDIRMKGINGLQLMQETHKTYPHIPFIIMTAYAPDYVYEDIINLGASDFISKPFSTGELRAKILRIFRERNILLKLHKSLTRVKKAFENTIIALASTLEIRDPYTAGHQRRVGDLASALGREIGLAGELLEVLRLASFVHDIGKIGVPSEILAKPGKLSQDEMDLIRTHSRVGFEILKPLEFPWPIAEMVLQHHERLNGSGYPQGLVGEEICLEARIIGVADVVEAMSAHRPYRPALDLAAALAEISQNRGILYDEKIVDACVRLFTEKGFKFRK